MRRAIALLLTATLVSLALVAAPAGCEERTPEPYTEDEFPLWARDLWRAEVILVGSIPFSLFLTFEVFDTYRFFTNGMTQEYAPWPFRRGEPPAYANDETTWLAVSALSISLAVSVVDFMIGRFRESAETPETR